MEQTLAEIWESSRSNQYSWLLPAVLSSGAIVLIIMSWIRHSILRRLLKIGLTIALAFCAMQASFMQIQEKWRIRHEWAEQNSATLSDKERLALISDGANLLLGPIIYGGGYSVLVFGISLVVSSVIVREITSNKQDSQQGDTSDALKGTDDL